MTKGSAGTNFAAKLLIAILVGLLTVPGAGIQEAGPLRWGTAALAQDSPLDFDYNGDGQVTCPDFEEEFPGTSTEEATAALDQFPDQLSNLDADDDGIACESGGTGSDTDSRTDIDGTADDAVDEQVDDVPIEPIPSDLPSDLPPLTVEAPGDCDVEVRAGRAFVFTDCADGSVDAGFEPFEGFDEFAASAENGFGAFDDTGGPGTTSVEVQQAAPVNGSTGRTTSQPSESSATRLVEGEQPARDGKAKQAKKAKKKKSRKVKKSKRKADRKAKRMRQARSFVTDNNVAR